jgi:cation diffusion facilitator family transporter
VSSFAADASLTATAVRRVLLWTLLLNVLVSAGKIVVGTLSGSLAMVADGFHSMTDGLNNVVGLVVISFAYKPPDVGHPYGHRKFETAATLFIGLGLLAVSYNVVERALAQVTSRHLASIGLLNWLVMGVTLLVNVFVAWYERREGRRLGSPYLIADSAHTRSDIYVTLGVTVSFAGARAGLPWMDGLVAAGIAAFIAYLAVQILIGSFNTLTDRAVLPAESLESVVLGVAGVRDCRDIRTRGGAGAVYVDLTVHVDGEMRLSAAHAVADRIEAALQAAHPEIVDVVVHLEPA